MPTRRWSTDPDLTAPLGGSDQPVLRAVMNVIDDPVLVFDTRGPMLLWNRPAEGLLGSLAAPEELIAALRDAARPVGVLSALPPNGCWTVLPGVELLEAAGALFFVRACRWEQPIVSTEVFAFRLDRRILPSHMQTVRHERLTSVRDYLMRTHGLTPQEVLVALLLAQRRSNVEVAREMSVSVHTARHHTESVLAKLGIRRRADVARDRRAVTDRQKRYCQLKPGPARLSG